jgi:sialate O-acetylesterase
VNKKSLFLLLPLLFLAPLAEAKLKLPALIGDHMVLQRGTPAVWGWADAGQAVTVSLAGKTARATADQDGKWKVTLPLPAAGGPYDMVIQADEAVTVSDVLVGDVWVGSGQSNMEFAMKTSNDADKEIPAADFPKIRLFKLDHVSSFTPLEDVPGSWSLCTPASVADFSAVAYHFGKEVHQALKVPVGLVESCWGGTAAEAWTPRPALDAIPDLAPLLKDWDNNQAQIKTWTKGNDFELWLSDIKFIPKDPKDKPLVVSAGQAKNMLSGSWSTSAKPGSQASVTVAGKAFSGNGAAVDFTGMMQGGGWGGLATNLSNSPVDLSRYGAIEFYAKGSGQFRLTLGQPSIPDYDYYAMKDPFDATPDWKLMHVEIADLKQGGWGAPKPFTPEAIQSLNFSVQVPYWPDIPSVVYNGMAAPLTPMRIKGVLWYQGESNTGRSTQYPLVLSALIQSWRQAWGEGNFPFIIFQLPNFMAVQPQPSESAWAQLRDAQLQVSQTQPRTGLVTTIDLGDPDNIHPKDKTDVGHRAALWALSRVYYKPLTGSGPLLSSARVRGPKVVLSFENRGTGLATKDGGPVTGFALAGDDQKFYWATALIKGNWVIVHSDQVPQPKKIRYAWADNPICNLANRDGLMASPFSADVPTLLKKVRN